MLGRNSKYLGLDIGSACTKAVLLSCKGGKTVIEAWEAADTRGEGLLNEQELYSSVAQKIASLKWDKYPAGVSLPQYLGTTMTRDFPLANATALENMILCETGQVAGLSEEALVQDYCLLPAGYGRNNPVLIGLAREQTVREKLLAYSNSGIEPAAMGMGGLAIADCFLQLHPEAAKSGEVVLLLELGHENSTAVVLAGGQPLFISTLMFSGEKFEVACKSRDAQSGGKVTLQPKDVAHADLREEIGQSPLLLAARILEGEIHGALETWRAQEIEPLNKVLVSKVFICGGVSSMKGLPEWLEERLETPVTVFGPQIDDVVHPELAGAYGAALQAAGCGKLAVSMLSEDFREKQRRRKNWPLLAAALLILVLSVCAAECLWFVSSSEKIQRLEEENASLEACGALMTSVEKARNTLYSYEGRMIPLVEAGNQAYRISDTLEAMRSACGDGDWFVYLADYGTYQASRKQNDNVKPQKNSSGSLFSERGKDAGLGDAGGLPQFPVKIVPASMPLTEAYISAGYTPHQDSSPFEPVRKLARKLGEDNLFGSVDALQESERIGREDIFIPWMSFLKKVPGRYKAFSLRMPFEKPDVNKPAIPLPKKGKGKKK